jgi:(p)ppGpp synthase/HD superfamily hydrolase
VDIRTRFGERTARIVEACSDSLADTGKGERKAHWEERKKAYLAHLRTADEDILRVSLADKVHNARNPAGSEETRDWRERLEAVQSAERENAVVLSQPGGSIP